MGFGCPAGGADFGHLAWGPGWIRGGAGPGVDPGLGK